MATMGGPSHNEQFYINRMNIFAMHTFALLTLGSVLTSFLTLSISTVYAQYYPLDNGEQVSTEQRIFCVQNEIYPCTQNNILAKQRVATNGPDYQQDPASPQSQMMIWLFLGVIIVAVISVAAMAIVVIKIKRPPHAKKV
jgi:hypothetical protein